MKDSERMVISAYLDGEVEAPWNDRVRRKIEEDPQWTSESDLQKRVKDRLSQAPDPDFSGAQGRVLHRVLSQTPVQSPRSVPLTWLSVAAALLVLAVGGGYWWGRQSTVAGPSEVSELQVQVPSQLELKLSGEGQLLMASTLQRPRP